MGHNIVQGRMTFNYKDGATMFQTRVLVCFLLIMAGFLGQPAIAKPEPKLVWGYINTAGEYLVKPTFDSAYTIYEGRALVGLKGRFGYLDNNGKFAIKPQFESACDFLGGQAQVKTAGKWGFIDHSGKFIVKPTNPEFTQPLCATGKLVIPARYANAFEFGEGTIAPVAIPAAETTK
jgi:hypothetical protein